MRYDLSKLFNKSIIYAYSKKCWFYYRIHVWVFFLFFFYFFFLFYNPKSYFIYFTYSFNNTLYIPFSIFPYNQSYQDWDPTRDSWEGSGIGLYDQHKDHKILLSDLKNILKNTYNNCGGQKHFNQRVGLVFRTSTTIF